MDTVDFGETRNVGPHATEEVIRALVREQTVYTVNPNVYYEPFIRDGRVGYRVQTNNAGDTRETFIYFNPSTDTDDGMPNVFVYIGSENDPSSDSAEAHFTLPDLADGPLNACGHNRFQAYAGGCHGCNAGEEPHPDNTELCCMRDCVAPATQHRGTDVYFPMCDEHYAATADRT